MQLANYIGGRFQPALSGATLDDIEPATGERVAVVPASRAEDVDAAVRAARDAATGAWGAASTAERADLCDAIADAIAADLDRFADLESRDTGKPLRVAKTVDIPRAIENFRFFAGAVRHSATEMHEMADAINYTLRRPLGVVGLITPWNLPLYLLSWKVAPALATGNAVVAKPSEITPLTAHALAETIDRLGAPKGAFNLVHGYGHEVGAAMTAHPGIDGISFTGGTATGKHVGASAGATFKKVSLELGGKNATLVFEDADLDRVLPDIARASFLNQGQICLCGSRILVHRSIHDRVVEGLAAIAKGYRIGDPRDPDTTFGSLTSHAHREKVEGYLALAVQEGGTIVTGGRRPQVPPALANGAFLEPTVITGLGIACRTATEEIFGPVATVHPFDTDAEAVAMANGVQYGLAASVWTRDLARAHRVAAALETGMVWVNCWLKRDLRVPFGGVKASGVGREGGKYSLGFYTNDKNVCIQL
ncbi:MAG: aldehyde dehydrogenase [Alphaproteobacteria bacterium]|nr:aldehyde dehydrogenase [Alphaproteobacteria bacterium]